VRDAGQYPVHKGLLSLLNSFLQKRNRCWYSGSNSKFRRYQRKLSLPSALTQSHTGARGFLPAARRPPNYTTLTFEGWVFQPCRSHLVISLLSDPRCSASSTSIQQERCSLLSYSTCMPDYALRPMAPDRGSHPLNPLLNFQPLTSKNKAKKGLNFKPAKFRFTIIVEAIIE